MANKIQVKRGLKASLPTLNVAEFGLCTDTMELYIGTASGNVLINIVPSIIDNLTSTSATSALSANQGRLLNDAVNLRIPTSQKGVASGVATLGTDSIIPIAQIPVLAKLGIGYGTSTTAAATTAKVATLTNFTLVTGAIVGIAFTYANTNTAPTLNVNSTGAKPIYCNGVAIKNTMITANMVALLQYNGTQWVLLNPAGGGAVSDITALHVLQITFDSSFAGRTFTVTGDGTRTGVVPSSAPYVVNVGVSLPNTTYTVTVSSYSNTVTTGAYFGLYPVKLEPISTILANNTWAQIASVSAAGNASSYWSIGDTKDIVVAGETLTLQIFGFNHDDLAASGKAGITFGLKNLMATTRQMNTSNTNSGGFTSSAMYTWLNSTLLPTLPSDLQSVVKSVNKKTSAGSQSSTINTNSMKMFLFSEIECFGGTMYSVAGEGTQYPIFTTAASRIKYLSNGSGSAYYWWERSPHASTSTHFCGVGSGGDASSTAGSSTGVCFGFCI